VFNEFIVESCVNMLARYFLFGAYDIELEELHNETSNSFLKESLRSWMDTKSNQYSFSVGGLGACHKVKVR